MKRVCILTLTILLALALLIPLPVFAEEITTAGETVTEAVTETVTETEAVTEAEPVTEAVTEAEPVTEPVTEEAETKAPVEIDEWIYAVMQQATPDQVKLIEGIVLGGVNALDKLEIEGFDRVRVWVEYNMATVMVAALVIALVAFFVVTLVQKRQLHSDSKDFYKAGVEDVKRAEEACKACKDAAEQAVQRAEEVGTKIDKEREIVMAALSRCERASKVQSEVINFLMQCSDLSQAKRDEAEAIFRRGMEDIDDDSDKA
jgi:predicted Holliday junction resolvase-like endonuclease